MNLLLLVVQAAAAAIRGDLLPQEVVGLADRDLEQDQLEQAELITTLAVQAIQEAIMELEVTAMLADIVIQEEAYSIVNRTTGKAIPAVASLIGKIIRELQDSTKAVESALWSDRTLSRMRLLVRQLDTYYIKAENI